jgi:hypothetical protein
MFLAILIETLRLAPRLPVIAAIRNLFFVSVFG